jgi:molybdopterin adenylyltransferase
MKIGRIVLVDPAMPEAKQDKMGQEVERVISSVFHEASQFVVAKVPAGNYEQLRAAIVHLCDEEKCPLVLTFGGTGPATGDFVPDVTLEVLDRRLPGMGEIMRYYSYERFKVSVLSRAEGGVRGRSLVINMPARPTPVKFCLRLLQEGIAEALEQLNGITPGLRGDEIVVPMERFFPFLKWIRPKVDPTGENHPTL